MGESTVVVVTSQVTRGVCQGALRCTRVQYVPTGAAQDKVIEAYHKLGLTGVISSRYITHIRWECSTSSSVLCT